MPKRFDYLVVGAGFAGSVIAERIASQLDRSVLLIERRDHIGGNAHDFYDPEGILIHKYGPHIFHTSSRQVIDYLSKFTTWRPYEHRVLASVHDVLYPIPINLDTVNRLYGLSLDAKGMQDLLLADTEIRDPILTAEDYLLAHIGKNLYQQFFLNYTCKQWGLHPSQLDRSVAARVPLRYNRDDRYFTDYFQAMPAEGYTKMFSRMLSHPQITLKLDTDFVNVMPEYNDADIIFTGPIDAFFKYQFGRLPYRSLAFETRTLDCSQYQPVAVINYPNDNEFTRITEYKHLTGQRSSKTTIMYEYPTNEGDPYYPIPTVENRALFQQYEALAHSVPRVHFCGRLGTYKYLNMDQVVAQALHLFSDIASGAA